jgi:toxin ParE1/3/4
MNRFSLSPTARADLRGIWKHIARDNQSAANRMRRRFEDVLLLLGQNPMLGQACDELRARMRFFCVGSYVVFYEVSNRGARIVRILHGAQDAQSMF